MSNKVSRSTGARGRIALVLAEVGDCGYLCL